MAELGVPSVGKYSDLGLWLAFTFTAQNRCGQNWLGHVFFFAFVASVPITMRCRQVDGWQGTIAILFCFKALVESFNIWDKFLCKLTPITLVLCNKRRMPCVVEEVVDRQNKVKSQSKVLEVSSRERVVPSVVRMKHLRKEGIVRVSKRNVFTGGTMMGKPTFEIGVGILEQHVIIFG